MQLLTLNSLPHMPILGSSNLAANKDMMSKIWINGNTIIWLRHRKKSLVSNYPTMYAQNSPKSNFFLAVVYRKILQASMTHDWVLVQGLNRQTFSVSPMLKQGSRTPKTWTQFCYGVKIQQMRTRRSNWIKIRRSDLSNVNENTKTYHSFSDRSIETRFRYIQLCVSFDQSNF